MPMVKGHWPKRLCALIPRSSSIRCHMTQCDFFQSGSSNWKREIDVVKSGDKFTVGNIRAGPMREFGEHQFGPRLIKTYEITVCENETICATNPPRCVDSSSLVSRLVFLKVTDATRIFTHSVFRGQTVTVGTSWQASGG